MDRILRKVSRFRTRLVVLDFLTLLAKGAFAGSAAACAAIALHRLFCPSLPIAYPLLAIAALSAAVPALAAFVRRPGMFDAAVLADLHNGFKERVSTAVATAGESHALAGKIVEDALAAVSGAMRPLAFRLPLEARMLPAPAAAALLLYFFMPALDILGAAEEAGAKRRERESVRRAAVRLLKQAEDLESEAKERKLEKGLEMAREISDISRRMSDNESEKKRALVELTKLADKAREMKRSRDLQSMEDAFKPENPGPLDPGSLTEKMLKALEKDGQSGAAGELMKQMEKLKEQLKGKGLSEEDRKKMERDLRRLSRDFKIPPELAEKLKKLADELAKRGMQSEEDRKYEDLEQDTEDMIKHLEELAKQLEDKEFLEKLIKQIEDSKNGLSGGQGGKTPLPGGGDGKDKGGKGNGGKGEGDDTGGAGTGKGGKPDAKEGDSGFKSTLLGGKLDLSGKIVGISTFKGLPESGEAKASYEELYSRFEKSAEDTLAKEKIPAEYKDYIKKYFDSIRPRREGGQ